MGIKGLGRDADQSPAYNIENESQWLYTPISLLRVFMAFVEMNLFLP